ncbi:MAG: hypothetical protein AAF849_08765 [Bacteroidota bacterium]
MKIFAFVLLLGLFHHHLLAQGLSFESDFTDHEVIPVDGKGFLLASSYATKMDSIVLVYWDINGQPKSTVTIPLKRALGELNLEDIFVWNDKVVVLKSLFYSGQQRNHLLLYEYSLPDLELIHSEQLTTAFNPFDLRLPFHYDLSPDSSKLLITAWSFFASDSLAQMELKIFDSAWQELEKRQRQLPYQNEKISIYGCKIDDESNAYILGDVYTGKNINYIKPQEITNFTIASFQGLDKVQTYEMKMPEYVVDTWHFELDQQQNLVAIGLCRESAKVLIEGSIFFRLSKKDRTISQFVQKVDKEAFIAAFEFNDLGFRTPKNRLIAYDLKNVFFKENTYYIIAERFNSNTNELQDIFVMSINLDGTLNWMRRLPKAQRLEFGTNVHTSFTSIEQEESLLFFYNGNASNFEKERTDKLKSTTTKNAVLCVTKLHLETQEISRQQLGDLFPKGYLVTPEFNKKIAADKVVAIANGIYNNAKPLNKFNVQILKIGR